LFEVLSGYLGTKEDAGYALLILRGFNLGQDGAFQNALRNWAREAECDLPFCINNERLGNTVNAPFNRSGTAR
jgi:hypothetical protein